MPQAEREWAELVTAPERVPELFRDAFVRLLGDAVSFPYTIFSPATSWGLRRTSPSLIALSKDSLFHLESRKEGLKTRRLPVRELCLIEHGTALLYSWVKLVEAPSGTSVTVEFNTVVEDFFLRLVEKLREIQTGLAWERLESGAPESLHGLNYKFYNYSRDLFFRAEPALLSVYQPAIRRTFALWLKKTLAVNRLLLVTESEVILLSDDATGPGPARYGIVRRWIPRRALRGVETEDVRYRGELFYALRLDLTRQFSERQLFAAEEIGTLAAIRSLLASSTGPAVE